MIGELDSHAPASPIDEAWTKHKFDMKLVAPHNRRRFEVTVCLFEREVFTDPLLIQPDEGGAVARIVDFDGHVASIAQPSAKYRAGLGPLTPRLESPVG